jgi:hypothetical protein
MILTMTVRLRALAAMCLAAYATGHSDPHTDIEAHAVRSNILAFETATAAADGRSKGCAGQDNTVSAEA